MPDWAFVDTGGKVTFAGFTGLGIENCSLERRVTMIEAQPHESAYPYRRQARVDYRINLDGLYDDTAPEHLVALAHSVENPTVTYKNANDVALFVGACVWESSNDNQRSHDFARQSGSLMSNGAPSTPA